MSLNSIHFAKQITDNSLGREGTSLPKHTPWVASRTLAGF